MEYFRTCENILVDFANTSVGPPRAAAARELQIQSPLASRSVSIRRHYQSSTTPLRNVSV